MADVKLSPAAQAEFPYTSSVLDVNGGRLTYIDEGDKDAPVVLCVHGNPTWSFYWRRIIGHYKSTHRVVVPDHIGCGRSDKPQGWSYTLAAHVGNLVQLIDTLDLRNITLVVHDWGGAIGMGAATKRPDRIDRIVVTNTAAFRSEFIPFSIATIRIPIYGPLAVRGMNGFARVATIRAVAKPLAPAARDGLLAPYNSWANRIATLRFVEDIPMHPGHRSWAELSRIDESIKMFSDTPMLICWGDDDFCFTPAFRKEWQKRFPAAECHAWEDVGHYVMEDAPERLLEAMDAFLARTANVGAEVADAV
jgi:pimeloyl-ACP methyl ester carboxylesterase